MPRPVLMRRVLDTSASLSAAFFPEDRVDEQAGVPERMWRGGMRRRRGFIGVDYGVAARKSGLCHGKLCIQIVKDGSRGIDSQHGFVVSDQ